EPGGFPKRYDVEVSESDGLTRLKGETEPFSGQVVMRNKEWKMGYLATYLEGKQHGPEIRFYPDGVTMKTWFDWVDGEKVRHRDFYETGQIQRDAMMKDGIAYGRHRRWGENGLLRFDGNFTDNIQWHGHIRDRDADGNVLWDAIFENGRYISGVYPKSEEENLIKGGMLDPDTLQPTAKPKKANQEPRNK
ncbi:MAG: hypothetical protein HKN23_15150, partial [Verrucomicrobiales bacterium]|nr:hypothetical protein [Verrucomicrobiales bacterium]